MKKNEITIGGVYVAKVSGKLVPVSIIRANSLGGWDAVSTVTGREIRIRTAARLRRTVNQQ